MSPPRERVKRISATASLLGVAIGLFSLASWLFGSELLLTVVRGTPPVMPNTAVGLTLAGVASAVFVREPVTRFRRVVGSACAIVVLLIGLLTTVEYVAVVDLGIDQILFETELGGWLHPGRPSPPTGVSLLILGIALLAFDVVVAGVVVREWLTLAVVSVALLSLVGDFHEASRIPALPDGPIGGVSIHAATSLLAIGTGILLARPNIGLPRVVESILRHIRERERFERELLETKNLLQNVLDSATESGIIALDLEHRVVLWNEGARRLFGHRADEVVGKPVGEFYSEESLGSLSHLLNDALSKGSAMGSFRFSPSSGPSFLGQVVITRRDGPTGRPMGFLLITNDVTPELRLAEQNEVMARVSETLVATMDIRDLASRVAKSVVPGFADACGLFFFHDRDVHVEFIHLAPDKAEVVASLKRIAPLSGSWIGGHPSECCLIADLDSAVLGQKTEQMQLLRELPARSIMHVPLLARDLSYGAIVFLLTASTARRYDDEDFRVAQEIARRTAVVVENVLLSEDYKLRGTIAGHLPEGIVLTTRDGGVIAYTNPRFDQMFGYEVGELLGRHIAIVNAPSDLSAEERATEIITHLDMHGTWYGEIKNIRKDGSTFWCYASVSGFEHPRFGPVWASVHIDISDRKRLEAQNEQALRDKEMLLREVHHRVKNNLQIIASLLYLQGRTVRDAATKQILEESRDRIHSIALVHELLYSSSSFAAIVFDDYLRAILAGLTSTHGAKSRRIDVELHAGNVILSIEHAVPCGLLVSELLTNAFKHAFPSDRAGKIRVGASRFGEEVVIEVADDGVGIPVGADWRTDVSMGMQLIQRLTKQLHGAVELDRSRGTRFAIRFPCPAVEAREGERRIQEGAPNVIESPVRASVS